MKKLIFNIVIFFHYLMRGLHTAEKVAFKNDSNTLGDLGGIEQENEEHNVYKDLLKGEVTQEVKELRHEMYYAERLSKKYTYTGNGSVKKNTFFDYNGKIENSDGCKIRLIQENKEEITSLSDMGVYSNGIQFTLSEKAQDDLRLKDVKTFTINLNRNFISRFKLEEYTTKIVVKEIDEKQALIDFYTPQYVLNKKHVFFLNEINSIYEGNERSEILDFDDINFISYGAYGVDDLLEFEYNNIHFETILKFDGSFILRFLVNIVKDGNDLIAKYYDKSADEKSLSHAPRENAKINFLDEQNKFINEDNYDTQTAQKLIKNLK